MKLALHHAFRRVGATDHDARIAAETIDGAVQKRMTDRQTPYAKLSDLQVVRTEVIDLKSQFSLWRGEVKQEISGVRGEITVLRAELKQDIAAVRSELKQDIASVRSEVTQVRSELKQDIAAVRGEMSLLRGDVKQDLANTRTELIRWMVGGQLATVTLVASLLFGMLKYLHP